MPHYSEEEIQKARQVDLLSYLQTSEPSELVHVSGQTYCTREHDSLKISNGKWYWFSRGFGGVTALDYLIKVKGCSLPKAVEAVLGTTVSSPPLSHKQYEKAPRNLLLPEKNNTVEHVVRYLRGRGIHPAVIKFCLEHDLLYESKDYHNAVFIGYDEVRRPRYAAIRSTIGFYKGDATGSDKHYSFHIEGDYRSGRLHIFESAIDLLSYATLQFMKGHDWKQDALLSLAGVFQTRRKDVLPVALERYLAEHPEVNSIYLHLDNDEVGRAAAEGIKKSLADRYLVLDEPPSCGKDVNDQLMTILKTRKNKEEYER